MVTVMSFCSAARICWVSVVWFTSALSAADVDLQVKPLVEAECGQNVTLTCEAGSSRQMDIKLFSWVGRNKTCQFGNDQPEPEVLCESSRDASRQRLDLTLLSVMPTNQGKYICKLQSNIGTKDAFTKVTVRGCLERSDSFTNDSHAMCSFTGVYPSGVIHWFKGDVNLTHLARTREEEDTQGRFIVLSDLKVEKGTTALPDNCSLWIPSEGKYLSSQRVTSPMKTRSSGRSVALHWVCVTLWSVPFLTAFGKVNI